MRKSFLVIAATAFAVSTLTVDSAHSGPYPFGDPPYTLNWDSYPQIEFRLLEVELAAISLG